MPYRHFQVPCSGGEVEEALNRFLQQSRVLKVEKQFVAAGSDSFWAYQVHHEDGQAARSAAPGISDVNRKGMVDYKALLSEADFTLFLKLKEWRKERAQKDGVEAFTIFTNAQLADIAHRRCANLAALKEISGIGEGRVEKYGAPVLDLVKESPPAPQST